MNGYKKDSKDPSRDDIPSGLLRQRRNLFVISLVLLFVYYSGVKIETASLKILGAELTLSNPKVFDDFQILWVAWTYFLVRYTQYIKFYGVMSDIASEYNNFLHPLYTKFFLSHLTDKIPGHFSMSPWVNPLNVKFNLTHGFRYISSGYEEPNTTNGLKERRYSQTAIVEKLSIFSALYCSGLAFIRLITTSRHVSDYWLPYIIAAVPAYYLGVMT